jgi:pyruvate formate lyase activating enzyme
VVLLKGRISKFESFGAVDGPGLRFVVFFQGCNLRCACCHNPETWDCEGGTECSSEEVLKRVLKFKDYFGDRGGVTFSGGEPLVQAKFLSDCAESCNKNGIHTVLDTSGSLLNTDVKKALKYIDLVILDIKMTNENDYFEYSKGSLKQTLDFLDELEKMKKDVWIRQVIIPGINDSGESIKKLKKIIEKYGCIKKTELLPFRKLCTTKYNELGIDFKLKDVRECYEETLKILGKNLL